jgi:DNA repair protein RadC
MRYREENMEQRKLYELQKLWKEVARERPESITKPIDAIPYLAPYARKKQEHMIVLILNTQNQVIKRKVIGIGLLNTVPVHPREAFRDAIKANAASIILAHNHPSGCLKVSEEDNNVFQRFKEAGELLGIPLLDFIVVGELGYLSYKERGELR